MTQMNPAANSHSFADSTDGQTGGKAREVSSPAPEPTDDQASPGLFDEVAAAPGYRPRLVADTSTRRRARRDETHPARTPARSPVRNPPRIQAVGRQVGGGGVLLRLAARLTVRDRWLLRMLLEHRVLTTSQIAQLAFGTQRMANVRLRTLHQLGVVDRFRPYTDRGSAPLHYVLSSAGADVLAATYDTTVADLGYRPERLANLAVALHLAHDVGANGIFTALAAHARQHDDPITAPTPPTAPITALTEWWSERRCLNAWDGLIRPDGYGCWQTSQGTRTTEVDFFLEYDSGTANLDRLVNKLDGYARLAAASGLSSLILFWLPSLSREAHLHHAITAWQQNRNGQPTLPIATAVPLVRLAPNGAPRSLERHTDRASDARPVPGGSVTAGPADPVWLPVAPQTSTSTAGRSIAQGRRTLADLESLLPPTLTELHGHVQDDGVPDDVTEAPDPRAPHPIPPGWGMRRGGSPVTGR